MSDVAKINKKVLNCHLLLSTIYNLTSSLVEDVSQENLDNLSSAIAQCNNANMALQNAIKTFILDMAGIPSEEIDVEPDKNGFKA